ncbi:glycine-rich domain-containing protein [Comamonas sp.]|uniref:glycine-rich domain-containing protein n=1 Tax=Comamonas sp. TaxID=34028 RepID=UPI003FA5504F
MTDIVPVPEGVHSTPFPTNADRTAGTFNPKVVAWNDSTRAQSVRDREIALTAYTNAVAAYEAALAAGESEEQAATSALAAFNEANRSHIEANRSEAGAASAWVAAAAAGAEAGLPAFEGHAGDVLTVNPTGTGVLFAQGTPNRGVQVFTASQAISKSMFGSATFVLVELWGGGASGDAFWAASGEASGGEGGAWDWCLMRVADLVESSPLVVGSGGAAVSASNGLTPRYGIAGGKSSFSGFEVGGGYGGTGLGAGAHSQFSGWTGGWGAGTGSATANDTDLIRPVTGPGGSSLRGGGGGGSSSLKARGSSVYGGNGGAGATLTATGSATSGAAPSGGGGGVRSNTAGVTVTSGAGARGQARFTWW